MTSAEIGTNMEFPMESGYTTVHSHEFNKLSYSLPSRD